MAFYVYRQYDKTGTLLYVGMTRNLESRTKQHMKMSVWRKRIAKITSQRLSSRETAIIEEYRAIVLEEPLYNNSTHLSKKSVMQMVKLLKQGASCGEIGKLCGISRGGVPQRKSRLIKCGFIKESECPMLGMI